MDTYLIASSRYSPEDNYYYANSVRFALIDDEQDTVPDA